MDPRTTSRTAMLETLEYCRPLGFFADSDASNEDLVSELVQRYVHHGRLPRVYNPTSTLDELGLLGYDEARVWWKDCEADVCRKNRVYTSVLQEWGEISRGAFIPTQVQETWDSEEGPIRVSFRQHQQACLFHPEWFGDWLDVAGLVDAVNLALQDADSRVELCETHDQTICAIFLSGDEKRQLQTERGWGFLT